MSTENLFGSVPMLGATNSSNQHKIVRTSFGTLLAFSSRWITSTPAYGPAIGYYISTDNGTTWTDWQPIQIPDNQLTHWPLNYSKSFDIYIDTNDDILLVSHYSADYSGTYALVFVKLEYSSGDIWIEGTPHWMGVSVYPANPSITRKTNGDIYVSYNKEAYAGETLYCYKSSDEGINWSDVSYTSFEYTPSMTSIMAVGDDIWVFALEAGISLVLAKYNGSTWSKEVIANTGSLPEYLTGSLSSVKISDSEIYCAATVEGGINVYQYIDSEWDNGTLVADESDNEYYWGTPGYSFPVLAVVKGKPVMIWGKEIHSSIEASGGIDAGPIYYRVLNDMVWEPKIEIEAAPSGDPLTYYGQYRPTTCAQDLSYLCLEYISSIPVSEAVPESGHWDPYEGAEGAVWVVDFPEQPATYNLYSNKIILPTQKSIRANASIISRNNQKILPANAKIFVTGTQKTIASNAQISILNRKYLYSNAKVFVTADKKYLTSNAHVKVQVVKTITSEYSIHAQALTEINNIIKFTTRKISDILSDVRFQLGNLYDLGNIINIAKTTSQNIISDFRTQLKLFKNITNDVRFINTDIRPLPAIGFQSLGKEYIRVYINSVEQTDVDVDSIIIHKAPNQAATATFDLNRAYDSTKPTLEYNVEITYNDWTLFYGYIIAIAPSDSPESMRIECQNKYWLDNRTNKYFRVGHKPSDNLELYYETINSALSSEYSWNLDLGNFVPETIDCFYQNQATTLTSLLDNAGNYGWFYDENENRILWTAGEGNIVQLQRQIIGQNLDLYQVLEHNFSENSDNIVNQFRVQMGQKTVATNNSTRLLGSYYEVCISSFLTPDWDPQYEQLAKNSSEGYGLDKHLPEYDYLYEKVFRVWKIPVLGINSEYTDKYPPVVTYWPSGYGDRKITSGLTRSFPDGMEDGFTVDYEKLTVTFSEPQYEYYETFDHEIMNLGTPTLEGSFWVKHSATVTFTPSENPETDVSNPQMFFTTKVGSYPTTIIKDLNLTNLSIQIGGKTGVTTTIPSWDDTAFAQDYAYWQLSKTSEKTISGRIKITLDAACFYSINLSKRISIPGITEAPMNILSISYNLSDFTVDIELENLVGYKRTVSLATRGE